MTQRLQNPRPSSHPSRTDGCATREPAVAGGIYVAQGASPGSGCLPSPPFPSPARAGEGCRRRGEGRSPRRRRGTCHSEEPRGDEESRSVRILRARFLASLGMTQFRRAGGAYMVRLPVHGFLAPHTSKTDVCAIPHSPLQYQPDHHADSYVLERVDDAARERAARHLEFRLMLRLALRQDLVLVGQRLVEFRE